jgi:nucleolar protein 56
MNKILRAKTPIGILTFDEKGKLVDASLFSGDSAKAAEQYAAAPESDPEAVAWAQVKMRSLALEKGFAKSDAELNAFLTNFSLALSQKALKGAVGRDRLVIQASNALEDLAKITNQLLMRVAEWYGLHYPEAKMDYEKLARKVAEYGRRENWSDFKTSTGAELTPEDENAVKEIASLSASLLDYRKSLEAYVKSSMKEIAPNFSSLLDPLLAARLLAAAGGMEKLAKMSSSTIQLIGAEKALFRHLRQQGKAPKYGLLFMAKQVQEAPEALRGKAARALAAKLMQAIRIDYFGKRDESARLKKELEEELRAMK